MSLPKLPPTLAFRLIIALWLIFLVFQPGLPHDEAEHLHIAWQMQAFEWKPVSDFFEHHQPAIWHILGTLFQLQIPDDYLIFAARVYLLFAGLISVLLLEKTARRKHSESTTAPCIPGYVFMLSTTFMLTFFVVRPESFATPFIAGCALLWTNSFDRSGAKGRLMALFAGLLGMIGVMISPRFALLGPGIFLLAPLFLTLPTTIITHAIAGTLGSLLGIASSMILFDQSLFQLAFNVGFSAHLQNIGVGWYDGIPVIIFFFLALLLLHALLARSNNLGKGVLLLHAINLFLVLGLSIHFMGKYFYSQGLFPIIVWSCILAAWQIRYGGRIGAAEGRVALSLSVMVATYTSYQISRFAIDNVFAANRQREILRLIVPPDNSVLISYANHPLTRRDSGYYGIPILEGRNRLCDAVESYRQKVELPPCDFRRAIMKYLPALVDKHFFPTSEEAPEYARFMANNYRYNPDLNVLIRKDIKLSSELLKSFDKD